MISISYSEAAVEVLDILNHTKNEDVNKIPKSFIEFLKKNSSKEYKAKIDHTKSIKDMKLKPKTEAILGLIYMKYWASKDKRVEFENKLNKREKEYQEQLRKKYNAENLFKRGTINN